MGYPKHQGRLSTRYSPVRHFTQIPKVPFSFDLHVLSTPPAFVLSQDQTLQFNILTNHNRLAYLLTSKPKNFFGPFFLLFSFQRSIRQAKKRDVCRHLFEVRRSANINCCLKLVNLFFATVCCRTMFSVRQRGVKLTYPQIEVNEFFR